jgi:hypothetical protein
MPVHAVSFANEVLAGTLGAARATGSRDSHLIRLWVDNPGTDSPTEVDWDGYDPPEWQADDWATPDAGECSTSSPVDFGAPGSAGTDAARYWSLHDVGDDELLFSAPLSEPFRPPEGGGANPVLITPTTTIRRS